MPFQIEDDPIYWLIGVKCRKITYGYCSLKIAYRNRSLILITIHMGIYYTQHNTDITSPRIQIQNQIICVCTWRLFSSHANREMCMRHCASQLNSSSTFLLIRGSYLISIILMLSNKKLHGNAQQQQNSHIHVIDLFHNHSFRFLFVGTWMFVLVFKIINNCLLYSTISYNHIYYINSYLNYTFNLH